MRKLQVYSEKEWDPPTEDHTPYCEDPDFNISHMTINHMTTPTPIERRRERVNEATKERGEERGEIETEER